MKEVSDCREKQVRDGVREVDTTKVQRLLAGRLPKTDEVNDTK